MDTGKSSLGSEVQAALDLLSAIRTRGNALEAIKELLAQNIEKEHHIMSQITDWAEQEQADLTAVSATLDTVVAGVTALDKLITDFQNSPGTLSAADQAALDARRHLCHCSRFFA